MSMKIVSLLLLLSVLLAGVIAWDLQHFLDNPFDVGELGLMMFGSVLSMSIALFLIARRVYSVSDN